ncbi:MAG: glycosyltransferase [Desulfarculaceae bacterium]|nr:glycosyltransferase [Desulfarculaceae bacterium]
MSLPGLPLDQGPLVLAVSFHYPPAPEPRAVQVHRLLAAARLPVMLLRGHDVITDPDASVAVGRGFTPLAEVLLRYDRGRGLLRRQNRWLRRGLPVWGRTPDAWRSWARPATQAALRHLRLSGIQPEVVVSFAFPWSDHLVGQALARELNLPWVAHFSDLWSDWPFRGDDRWSAQYNRRLEERIVAGADLCLFPTGGMAEVFMRKYPEAWRGKARVLPHLYDPEAFGPGEFAPGGERIIRYLGSLYGSRSPKPLFQALGLLLRESPTLLEGVRLEIVGEPPLNLEADQDLAALPPGLVEFTGRVSYQRSLELMQSAEALMLLEFPAEESVWLPSKLVDYLGAGRPILGIAPPGEAADFILRAGGAVAPPGDPVAVAVMLTDYLQRPPAPTPWGDAAMRQEYEATRVAGLFKDYLREVLNKKKSGL